MYDFQNHKETFEDLYRWQSDVFYHNVFKVLNTSVSITRCGCCLVFLETKCRVEVTQYVNVIMYTYIVVGSDCKRCICRIAKVWSPVLLIDCHASNQIVSPFSGRLFWDAPYTCTCM